MSENSERRSLLPNAVLLTAVSFLMRTAGISYRAFVTYRIGPEGMGLYTLVQTAFLFTVTVSTAGLSTAVTRVVSENRSTGRGSGNAVLHAFCYALPLGALSGLLLYSGAPYISTHFLGDVRSAQALRVLAWSLPVMSAAAVLKGYFYARREALLPAVSDVLEQGTEMLVFLLLSLRLRGMPAETGCAVIAVGTAVSEAASCAFLLMAWIGKRRGERDDREPVLRRFLRIALPVSGSACLGAGLRAAENALIPKGLEAYGDSHVRALTVYGQVRGMALPLIFYPAAFLSPFAALLIPEIAGARASGRICTQKGRIVRILRFTLLLSFLVGGLLTAFSRELAVLVYRNAEIGRILLILAPLTPFMYLDPVVDGMLKGFDEQQAVLRYNILDSSIRLIMVFLLIPRTGFTGFMLVMYVSNILNPVLSVRRLMRVSGLKPDLRRQILHPVLCTGLAAAAGRLLAAAGLAQSAAGLLVCSGVICFLFFTLLTACGVWTEEDSRYLAGCVRSLRGTLCRRSYSWYRGRLQHR